MQIMTSRDIIFFAPGILLFRSRVEFQHAIWGLLYLTLLLQCFCSHFSESSIPETSSLDQVSLFFFSSNAVSVPSFAPPPSSLLPSSGFHAVLPRRLFRGGHLIRDVSRTRERFYFVTIPAHCLHSFAYSVTTYPGIGAIIRLWPCVPVACMVACLSAR